MAFQITIGSWIIPLILTAGGLAWAIPLRDDERNAGGMFGALSGISAVFRTGCVIIASLIAWLVWALCR